MNLEALITARPEHRSQLSTWYPKVLVAAESEGVTIPDLATRLGCSPENLYRWRRGKGSSRAREPRLVRAAVAKDPVTSSERLEVRTRNGLSVTVPTAFDPAALAAVLSVVEAC